MNVTTSQDKSSRVGGGPGEKGDLEEELIIRGHFVKEGKLSTRRGLIVELGIEPKEVCHVCNCFHDLNNNSMNEPWSSKQLQTEQQRTYYLHVNFLLAEKCPDLQ